MRCGTNAAVPPCRDADAPSENDAARGGALYSLLELKNFRRHSCTNTYLIPVLILSL